MEEAFGQLEFLSDFVTSNLAGLAGTDNAGTAHKLAKIYGEYFDDKYFFWEDDTKSESAKACKLKAANAVRFVMDSSPLAEAFKQTCQNVLSPEQRVCIETAYGYNGQ